MTEERSGPLNTLRGRLNVYQFRNITNVKSLPLISALLLALALAITSLFVGVSNVSLATLFAQDTSADALRVLVVSRIPAHWR